MTGSFRCSLSTIQRTWPSLMSHDAKDGRRRGIYGSHSTLP